MRRAEDIGAPMTETNPGHINETEDGRMDSMAFGKVGYLGVEMSPSVSHHDGYIRGDDPFQLKCGSEDNIVCCFASVDGDTSDMEVHFLGPSK